MIWPASVADQQADVGVVIAISLKTMRGPLKHMMAGMQILVTRAPGHGMIAFSRTGAGCRHRRDCAHRTATGANSAVL